MNLAEQLQPVLKNLRLSGLLETLDLRSRQAVEEKLSFGEFLQRILLDENERRAQKQLVLRMKRAALDPLKTLESFDFSANKSVPRALITDLAAGHFIEKKESVLISGPTGVGKSHLAHALGHEACRRGCDVILQTASKLLASLQAARADGTYDRKFRSYLQPDLLILDDLGLKPMRPPAPEDLFDLIHERYEKGSMLITSNRAFKEWLDLFGEPLMASAALDRLTHRSHQIVITGESYRARERKANK